MTNNSTALIFADNKKVSAIISELSIITFSEIKLLTEVQDGVNSASLTFHPALWSEEIENITKSIADFLDCNETFYAYDKNSVKIIVTFNKRD